MSPLVSSVSLISLINVWPWMVSHSECVVEEGFGQRPSDYRPWVLTHPGLSSQVQDGPVSFAHPVPAFSQNPPLSEDPLQSLKPSSDPILMVFVISGQSPPAHPALLTVYRSVKRKCCSSTQLVLLRRPRFLMCVHLPNSTGSS